MKKISKISKKLIFLCLGILLLFGFNTPVMAKESVRDTRPSYVIYVNRTQNCITVMEQKADGTSTIAKVMVCSCGKEGDETPEGIFSTSDYYDWRMMVDGSYGKYAVRFHNRILFHSVPYIEPSEDTLEWEQYNLLGQNASLGCVRLSVADVKWIYDNCKVGTPVIVYSGDKIVGDVTKPTALKIPENSPYRGWDPTDININNPWLVAGTAATPQVTPPIGSIENFDYIAYADRYVDVKAAFGYDKTNLYMHYMTCGIYEGRIAEFH